MFLDDIGANLKPARDLGMVTILVRDTDTALAELEKVTGVQVTFWVAPGQDSCPSSVFRGSGDTASERGTASREFAAPARGRRCAPPGLEAVPRCAISMLSLKSFLFLSL